MGLDDAMKDLKLSLHAGSHRLHCCMCRGGRVVGQSEKDGGVGGGRGGGGCVWD